MEEPPISRPPISLSLPPHTVITGPNGCGREARVVQAAPSTPGNRIDTEERGSLPSDPPATTNACTVEGFKGGLSWSHPSGRHSSTGMAISILQQLGELLDKAVDVVPAKLVLTILIYNA